MYQGGDGVLREVNGSRQIVTSSWIRAAGSGRGHGMRSDPVVVRLVGRALDGDKSAWDELVERYAPLVWSICRRHRLSKADSEDVGQSVWLRLVENLPGLREPAALPGWVATTTQRECLRLLRLGRRTEPVDPLANSKDLADEGRAAVDEDLLLQERRHAVRSAFAELSERCRRLLSLLVEDPPKPYGEISAAMVMPIGSIGPTRTRCLDKLRAALIGAEFEQTGGGERHAR